MGRKGHWAMLSWRDANFFSPFIVETTRNLVSWFAEKQLKLFPPDRKLRRLKTRDWKTRECLPQKAKMQAVYVCVSACSPSVSSSLHVLFCR